MRVIYASERECVFGCSARHASRVASMPHARVLGAREAADLAARLEADGRLAVRADLPTHAMLVHVREPATEFGSRGILRASGSLRGAGGARAPRSLAECRRTLRAERKKADGAVARAVAAEAKSGLRHEERKQATAARASSVAVSAPVTTPPARATPPSVPSTQSPTATADALDQVGLSNSRRALDLTTRKLSDAEAKVRLLEERLAQQKGAVATLARSAKAPGGGAADADGEPDAGTDSAAGSVVRSAEKPLRGVEELSELARSLKFFATRIAPPPTTFEETLVSEFLSKCKKDLLRAKILSAIATIPTNVFGSFAKPKEEKAAKTTAVPVELVDDASRVAACRLCTLYAHITLSAYKCGCLPLYRLYVAGYDLRRIAREDLNTGTGINMTDLGKELSAAFVGLKENGSKNLVARMIQKYPEKIVRERSSQLRYDYVAGSKGARCPCIAPGSSIHSALRAIHTHQKAAAGECSGHDAGLLSAARASSAVLFDLTTVKKSLNDDANALKLIGILTDKSNHTITMETVHTAEDHRKQDPFQCEVSVLEYAFWIASLSWNRNAKSVLEVRNRLFHTFSPESLPEYSLISKHLLHDPNARRGIVDALRVEVDGALTASPDAARTAISTLKQAGGQSGLLRFAIAYWEEARDDASFAQFIRDIHASITSSGIEHKGDTAASSDENKDNAYMIPLVCSMAHLLLSHATEIELGESQGASFGEPTPHGCPFEAMTEGGECAEEHPTLTNVEALSLPQRQKLAVCLANATKTPSFCDIHSWLSNMPKASSLISNIAACLYSDVDILSPLYPKRAACSSPSCCIRAACSGYATRTRRAACTMIEDMIIRLHSFQCDTCHESAVKLAWPTSVPCEVLAKYVPKDNYITNTTDAHDTFCAVSVRLSNLASLLRAVISEGSNDTLAFACKVALCAINIAASPPRSVAAARTRTVKLSLAAGSVPDASRAGGNVPPEAKAPPPGATVSPLPGGGPRPPPPPPPPKPPPPPAKSALGTTSGNLVLFEGAFDGEEDSTIIASYLQDIRSGRHSIDAKVKEIEEGPKAVVESLLHFGLTRESLSNSDTATWDKKLESLLKTAADNGAQLVLNGAMWIPGAAHIKCFLLTENLVTESVTYAPMRAIETTRLNVAHAFMLLPIKLPGRIDRGADIASFLNRAAAMYQKVLSIDELLRDETERRTHTGAIDGHLEEINNTLTWMQGAQKLPEIESVKAAFSAMWAQWMEVITVETKAATGTKVSKAGIRTVFELYECDKASTLEKCVQIRTLDEELRRTCPPLDASAECAALRPVRHELDLLLHGPSSSATQMFV
jgi:hypothetical protein